MARPSRRRGNPPGPEPGLEWIVGSPPTAELKRGGYQLLSFADIRREFIEPARSPTRRPSLENPAKGLFDLFERNQRVAVTGAPTKTTGDLHDVYGYLVEPAWRRGVKLCIYADRALDELRPEEFIESEFGYAWTLERLRYIAARATRQEFETGLPPLTPIEYRLLTAFRSIGLSPVVQYGIDKFRVDFAFPALQLAVEADGREWHEPVRDQRRDLLLGGLGWSVMRFTGSKIVREADSCAAAVATRCGQLKHERRYTATPQEVKDDGWMRRLIQRLRTWGASLFQRHDMNPDEEPSMNAAAEPAHSAAWLRELDDSQLAAVRAHDGVVQVLAPAGSGKTRVLIARVQELISRGVPANRILCCTFNREAKDELRRRLREAGVEHVVTKSFHGIGWAILNEQRLLRKDVGTLSFPQWRNLARQAQNAVGDGAGVWIDADAAAEAISRFKLVDLVTPTEARTAITANPKATPLEVTAVELYELYEQLLEEKELLDFDDLIMRSLRLLMENETVRREWQREFSCVLVDEYQDIEPAQERLVQILAAPHDSLFTVGDEDQCIYAWLHADVERILELDRQYPGLERHALETNYRCPSQVANGSRLMIEENQRRFPKTIRSPEHAARGDVEITAFGPSGDLALFSAHLLRDAEPTTTVVLARTRQLLRDIAIECARHGVYFKAGDFILDRSGPNRTLASYLRVSSDPTSASVDDVSRVFRVPNRYLPDRAAHDELASRLQTGFRFPEAVVGLGGGDEWRQKELDKAGSLFGRLALIEDAQQFIATIRTEGGLDGYYTAEQKLNQSDQSSIDALDAAEQRAAGKTLRAFADLYAEEADLIRQYRSDDGVELSTIHGAKGREWPWVILVNADSDTLPHRKSIDSAPDEEVRAAALEDERRLAYVALTRAKARLTILHHEPKSPFLQEAEPGFSDAQRDRIGFDERTPSPTT